MQPKNSMLNRPLLGKMRVENLTFLQRRSGIFIFGACLSLIFAPFDLPFVSFIIFPFVILFIQSSRSPKQAGVEGWFFGFGHFLTSLYWIGESFYQQQDIPVWLAPIAVILMAAILSLYLGFLFWSTKWMWLNCRLNRAFEIICFATLWVVVEVLRGFLLTGFPWNPLGVSWVSFPVMAQTGSIWGVYGLSFLTLYFSGQLTFLFGKKLSDLSLKGAGLPPLILGVLVVGFGVYRLETTPLEFHEGIKLRLVQPNISQLDKWRDDLREGNFFDQIKLSTLKGQGENNVEPSHFIWSESAITYLIDRRPDLRANLGDMLSSGQVLISGAPRLTRENGKLEAFNSVFAFDDTGLIRARYDKSHLVPFGEYVPLRSVLSAIGLEKLVPGAVDFSPGPGPQTLNIPGLPPVSPLVCYEIIFSGNVLDNKNRPDWLLNLTNDGWFGMSSGPYQHLAMARMRAIEEGLPVVRNAGSGISAVITPLGLIHNKLNLNTRGVLDVYLPKKTKTRTLYSYFPNYIFLVFLAITAVLVLKCRTRGIKVHKA